MILKGKKKQKTTNNGDDFIMKTLDKSLLKQNIEKIAEYDFENNKVFGSAYVVHQNGETVYKNCFGVTDSEKNIPVTENTLFRLASMTKPITAIAALILVERGLISLDDDIEKYLPQFKGVHITRTEENGTHTDLGEAQNKIKIYHLLSHTSGIGCGPLENGLTDNDRKTIENFINYFAKVGLEFEPGTQQAYSGTAAFDVMTAIIEQVTGMDYLSFLKLEIFSPCGMVDTTFIPTEEQQNRLMKMHAKEKGNNVVDEICDGCIFQNFPWTHFLGGAGLVSTISDYAKFAKMLLNRGKTENKQIISDETFKLMNTPYVTAEIMPGNERWGLGVRVITDEKYPFLPVGSFGWSGAYGSHFWIDPENKTFAVFLKNSRFDGGAANESACNFEKAVNESFIK